MLFFFVLCSSPTPIVSTWSEELIIHSAALLFPCLCFWPGRSSKDGLITWLSFPGGVHPHSREQVNRNVSPVLELPRNCFPCWVFNQCWAAISIPKKAASVGLMLSL